MQAQKFKLGWSALVITRQTLVDAQNAKEQKDRNHACGHQIFKQHSGVGRSHDLSHQG
jgi:hypothetical protein